VTTTRHAVRSLARVTVAGLAAALLVTVAGRLFEHRRLGATDDAALSRVQAELGRRFTSAADATRPRATSSGRRSTQTTPPPRKACFARSTPS
jgi:hypothetical protein